MAVTDSKLAYELYKPPVSFESKSDIINYIEYGCTSWGPIHYIIDKGFQCLSIIPCT